MKIPTGKISGKDIELVLDNWKLCANEISMETGTYIEVWHKVDLGWMTHIYFKIMDHQFESLKDLRKALNNKAFI